MNTRWGQSAAFGDEGVAAVHLIVGRELGWIWREQSVSDVGIDAHIEVVEEGLATGRLLAVQLKSGPSHFNEDAGDGWWYRPEEKHLSYWRDHSLPVIVALYSPEDQRTYWQLVTDSTVEVGPRGGRRIKVPRGQTLNVESKQELSRASEGKPYDIRVRQLRLALPWMRLLTGGRRLLLDAEEWVNKTSGRGDLRISSTDEAGDDVREHGTWTALLGSRPYDEVLPSLVPWASVSLHEETYDAHDEEQWESECVHFDREGDSWTTMTFEDWRAGFGDGLRPYKNGAGEVDFWRFELTLNDLGKGFMAVDSFAERKGPILTPPRSSGSSGTGS